MPKPSAFSDTTHTPGQHARHVACFMGVIHVGGMMHVQHAVPL